MPYTESDYRRVLNEYGALRMQEEQQREERVQEVYRKIPEIRSIDREIEGFGLRAMQTYLKTRSDPHELVRGIRAEVEALVQRKEALLQDAGFAADYMDIRYHCPLCRDTGYVRNEKCRCLKQRLLALAYEQSNLSLSLADENFDRFNPALFSAVPSEPGGISPRKNILRIREMTLDAIGAFQNGTPMNFLFYGAAGTGKTFLCSSIAREILNLGYTVLYLSAYDFCTIMNDYRFRRGRTEDESLSSRRIDLIDSSDLLILDDLGTEASNSVSVADLLHCINKRLQERRSTIISTNLSMQQIQKVYSDRMLSRITGYYRIVRFFGPDLRRPV